MRLIAHRGNVDGPLPERENTNAYLWRALERGFDIEADVRVFNNALYLGHDTPKERLDLSLFNESGTWWHAKESLALAKLLEWEVHCFFQEADAVVLTSYRILWTHETRQLWHPRAVLVIKDPSYAVHGVYGVCTDRPIYFREGV